MLAIQTRSFPNSDVSEMVPAADGAFDQSVMGGATRIVNRKEHVFFEGDVVTHIYKVEAGHVCIYRLLVDGRRQVVDFAFPGDFIGLGASGHHALNAQATERTCLRCLPVSELRNVVTENPKLALELYEAIASELGATRELLMSVSHRTAQERIAGFLVALSQRSARHGEDGSTIVLPMTRTDIADFLGLTIETVSRTFSKLRAEGLINLEQCILVTVLDHDRLRAIAEGTESQT
jgi:CRP/FNR family transcriptional regulator